MIKAVDIKAELAGRLVLHGRGKETTEAEIESAFADLAVSSGADSARLWNPERVASFASWLIGFVAV
jgi:hypothetical protein